MPRPKRTSSPLKPTSFRLSERAKFAARFLARTGDRGTSEALELEKALEMMAGERSTSSSWLELWDENEAVRQLRLYALPEFKPSEHPRDNEKVIAQFLSTHAQFFYRNKSRGEPDRAKAEILWPHIDELATLWMTKKSEDYWCAAKQMASLLRKAKLDPPPFG